MFQNQPRYSKPVNKMLNFAFLSRSDHQMEQSKPGQVCTLGAFAVICAKRRELVTTKRQSPNQKHATISTRYKQATINPVQEIVAVRYSWSAEMWWQAENLVALHQTFLINERWKFYWQIKDKIGTFFPVLYNHSTGIGLKTNYEEGNYTNSINLHLSYQSNTKSY